MHIPEHLPSADHLLTTAEQLAMLSFYNGLWRAFSPSELNSIAVDDEPQDDLSNLRVLHADFGSPKETLIKWRSTYTGQREGMMHWNDVDLTWPESSLVQTENTRTYERGIHEVRIDLETYKEGNETTNEIRQKAANAGYLLAHGEALSTMGLHRYLQNLKLRPRDAITSAHTAGYAYHLGRASPPEGWVPFFDNDGRSEDWGLRTHTPNYRRRGAFPIIKA